MSDAHEALRKDVQQEAPQELVDRQGSELLLIVVRRIAPAKSDLAISNHRLVSLTDGPIFTDPSRTDFSNSDHRCSGLRTSETLGGEGTRSVERIRCAQNSSSIVAAPQEPAKDAFNAL
jgi:hypothetical protein